MKMHVDTNDFSKTNYLHGFNHITSIFFLQLSGQDSCDYKCPEIYMSSANSNETESQYLVCPCLVFSTA